MSRESAVRRAARGDVVGTVTVVREWLRGLVPSLAILVGIVVLWQVYAVSFNPRGDIYFPSVTYTLDQTLSNADLVVAGLRTTFTEVLVSFVLAVTVGVLLGVVVAESFVVRQMSMPLIVYLYAIPHAILAPLFLIWFGTDIRGVATFSAWVAFFPIFINTITGINQVDEEFELLGEAIGATRWQMLRHIKIWTALPNIASSVRAAVQLSIVGVIIAEFLATGSGLGYLIIKATQRAQIGLTFGTVISIMVFAVAFYKLVDLGLSAVVPGQS